MYIVVGKNKVFIEHMRDSELSVLVKKLEEKGIRVKIERVFCG